MLLDLDLRFQFPSVVALIVLEQLRAVIAVTQDLDFDPDALKSTMDHYGQSGSDNDVITEAWDSVQKDVSSTN